MANKNIFNPEEMNHNLPAAAERSEEWVPAADQTYSKVLPRNSSLKICILESKIQSQQPGAIM